MPLIYRWLLAGYIAAACITYGHAWANVKMPATTRVDMKGEARFILSFCSAVFWPIYVPICLFEKEEK